MNFVGLVLTVVVVATLGTSPAAQEPTPEWLDAKFQEGVQFIEKALRVQGEARCLGLAQAVVAFESILQVSTRGSAPWTAAQTNLAGVLQELGARTPGVEGDKFLVRAVKACKNALEVTTLDPEGRSMTLHSLGNALMTQGRRAKDEGGNKLLAEAVEAFRHAIKVKCLERSHDELGGALFEQGRRAKDKGGNKLLAEAAESFRSALKVTTLKSESTAWAVIQSHVGLVLAELGHRSEDEKGNKLLADAVKAFQSALKVRTLRHELPEGWALIQHNLGYTLATHSSRVNGEEGRKLLADAVAAFENALQVRTRIELPEEWAWTYEKLDATLKLQATRGSSEEKAKLEAELARMACERESYEKDNLLQKEIQGEWFFDCNGRKYSYRFAGRLLHETVHGQQTSLGSYHLDNGKVVISWRSGSKEVGDLSAVTAKSMRYRILSHSGDPQWEGLSFEFKRRE